MCARTAGRPAARFKGVKCTKMSNCEHIRDLLLEMSQDLSESGHLAQARQLSAASSNLNRPECVEETLKKVQSLCHIRIYGDLYLKNFDGFEWANKVGKLGSMCNKKLNKLKIAKAT